VDRGLSARFQRGQFRGGFIRPVADPSVGEVAAVEQEIARVIHTTAQRKSPAKDDGLTPVEPQLACPRSSQSVGGGSGSLVRYNSILKSPHLWLFPDKLARYILVPEPTLDSEIIIMLHDCIQGEVAFEVREEGIACHSAVHTS